LWKQYHFRCGCKACEEDWATADYEENYSNIDYLVEEIGQKAAKELGKIYNKLSKTAHINDP